MDQRVQSLMFVMIMMMSCRKDLQYTLCHCVTLSYQNLLLNLCEKFYFTISTQNWGFSVIKELPKFVNIRRQGFKTAAGAIHQYESRIISSTRHAGQLHAGEITADKHSYLRKIKSVTVGHYRRNDKEGRHTTA